MKKLSLAAGLVLPGLALAAAAPAASTPSLAILPLKAEGNRDLGDVAETINAAVAGAFADSGAFRLVQPNRVQALLPKAGPQGVPALRPAALHSLGQRLGAKFVLLGSYLPERNPETHAVVVTLTLSLVQAEDGSTVRRFLETGEGATLGGVIAALTRKLSADAAGAAQPAASSSLAAPVPAAIPATAPMAAAVPATPAPEAPAAPAVPAPAAPIAPVSPAQALAAIAPAPAPRVEPKVLLVLREGSINGIYYPKGGLSQFGLKLEDFEFLLHRAAGLFPPGMATQFDLAGGPGDDASLARLVRQNRPESLVVLTLDWHTQTKSKALFLTRTEVQAEVRVRFLSPDSLVVRAQRVLRTDFLPAGSHGMSPEMQDQLARQFARVLPTLPD